MIRDTTVLYILITVWVALTFIQSDSNARKQKFLSQFE